MAQPFHRIFIFMSWFGKYWSFEVWAHTVTNNFLDHWLPSWIFCLGFHCNDSARLEITMNVLYCASRVPGESKINNLSTSIQVFFGNRLVMSQRLAYWVHLVKLWTEFSFSFIDRNTDLALKMKFWNLEQVRALVAVHTDSSIGWFKFSHWSPLAWCKRKTKQNTIQFDNFYSNAPP